ncbi:hypothetical protein CBW54_01660 [Yersinia kristensenii]|nr:hypothetical protein CBW54_01660 [Yersinia kristensenii]
MTAINSPPLCRGGRIFTDFAMCNRFSKNLGIRESNASLQIGSLIIKFGNSGATVPVSGYQFSFPTPFPNACYALVVTGWQRPIGHTGRNKVGATLTTTDNIASIGFDYIAIGG